MALSSFLLVDLGEKWGRRRRRTGLRQWQSGVELPKRLSGSPFNIDPWRTECFVEAID